MKRSLLLVPVLFAALLVLPGAPAWACSCASPPMAELVASADVVMRGTLEDVDMPWGPSILRGSGETVTYRFAVSEVFRGEARETTYVSSSAYGASCGLEGLLPGREYVVLAQARGDALWSGLCDGTASAASGLVADVEQVTGVGHAPVLPGLVDSSAAPAGAMSGPGAGGWMVPLVAGGVLALVLTGLLLGVVLRGRRRV